MTRAARAVAAALAAATLAAGCAPRDYYSSSSGALDSLLTTQAEIMKRVNAIDRRLDATREGVQAARASSDTRLSELIQRLEVLEGKLEESGVRFTQLAQKVDTVKQRLSSSDSARIGLGGVRRDSTAWVDPEGAYQAAYSDYAAGRYNLAREAFREYLRRFPDTEISDNARYWLGECDYLTGDFAGAIAEFDKVIKDYPRGDKVPAAIFKAGVSYARLKNTPEAKRYYQRVIQKYPKSDEARLARERLAQK